MTEEDDGEVLVSLYSVIFSNCKFQGSRATWTYDAVGRASNQQDVTGVTSYTYVPNEDWLRIVDYPSGMSLSYSYEHLGRRLTLDEFGGARNTYHYKYDTRDNLQLLTNSSGELTTFLYTDTGLKSVVTEASGTVISFAYAQGLHETYRSYIQTGGASVAAYATKYDAAYHISSVAEADGSLTTYAYDAANQLLVERRSGTSPYLTTYTYDPLGNRLTKAQAAGTTTYAYDAANRMQTALSPSGIRTTYTFDANGNQTLEAAGAALTSYTWNYDNRLTVAKADSSVETYLYSADGHRQQKQVGATTTLYCWDGEVVQKETGTDLVYTARYTANPAGYGEIGIMRRSFQSLYYVYDPLRNTRIVTNASGVTKNSYLTNAFGEDVNAPSEVIFNPYRYGGQDGYQWDATSRLYVRARHLRTDQGRWASADPPGFDAGDWNLWRYVGNGPVGMVDPSGMVKIELIVKQGEAKLLWKVFHHSFILVKGESGCHAFGGGPGANGGKPCFAHDILSQCSLVASSNRYDKSDTRDYSNPPSARYTLYENAGESEKLYISKLNAMMSRINTSGLGYIYNILSHPGPICISNSVTTHLMAAIGMAIAQPSFDLPGWGVDLFQVVPGPDPLTAKYNYHLCQWPDRIAWDAELSTIALPPTT